MTNKFIIFSSIILVFFISSFADSAEFYKGVGRTRLLLIYGKIEKGDAQKFKKYIKEIKTERGFLERVFF